MSEPQTPPHVSQVTVVAPAEIDRTPWQPLRGLAGVEHKELWRSGEMTVGLVRMAPGAMEPGHVHHTADHHVYVLSGSALVAGQPVSSGGVVHVPAGAAHSTTAGPDGCTLFYTYAPRR